MTSQTTMAGAGEMSRSIMSQDGQSLRLSVLIRNVAQCQRQILVSSAGYTASSMDFVTEFILSRPKVTAAEIAAVLMHAASKMEAYED